MKKVKWGILSTGNIASQFAGDFRFTSTGELYGVASRSTENARIFAEKFAVSTAYGSYGELISDPNVDVLYIATPHHLHYDLAAEAIHQGKAVVCEKPLTTDQLSTKKLIDLALNHNVYLLEAMWMYFMPAIRQALDWAKKGAIGSVRHFQADFGFYVPLDPESRLFNPKLGGGAMLDIGIYPVAFSWLLMQRGPKNIVVKGKVAKTGVDSDVTVLADYGDVTGTMRTSFESQLFNHAIIFGDEGFISIPNFWGARSCSLFKDGKEVEIFRDQGEYLGYIHEINAVNDDVRSGRRQSGIMPLEYSLMFQQQMEKILSVAGNK